MIDEARPPSVSVTIRPLSAQDAHNVLEFEERNRGWFRSSVPDRGDGYFADYLPRHQALLDEQAAGVSRFWLVIAADGVIVGRVNLVDISTGAPSLGYRIGQEHVGRGYARAAVALVLREAERLGVQTVNASTTVDNLASQRVLAAAGFVKVPGEPSTLDVDDGDARPALHFRVHVAANESSP
jgi:ribosomal-protein-alanine N-acetyltransferase